MEPRPHERGKWLKANQVEVREVASMEPRPHERGKLSKNPSNRRQKPLQWSHVLTNVERRVFGARLLVQGGFNGATSSRTWKAPPLPRGRGLPEWLQWSHVLTNVESCGFRFINSRTSRLQWSHVLTNVERCNHPEAEGRSEEASMEPRPHERGKENACRSR